MDFLYLQDFLNNLVSEYMIPGVDCVVKKDTKKVTPRMARGVTFLS